MRYAWNTISTYLWIFQVAKLYDVRDLGVGVVKILLPSVCLMSKLASLLAMFTLFGSWIVNCF